MKKLIYWVLMLLMSMLINISQAWANEYYRGDKRTPEEVKAAGGFYPQTYSGGAPTVPLDMSLHQHIEHPHINSGYVSTSSDERVAGRFGAGGYLYTIRGDGNLIDAAFVLGQFYQRPPEREFAAFGGVPWRQIIGWERLNDRGGIVGDFVENPDYAGDDAFTGAPNPNPAQVIPLAGFPYDHPAWHMQPWNQYPFTGCGGFGSNRSRVQSSSDAQCQASERHYGWKYLSQYRTQKGLKKKVVYKGGVSTTGVQFPQELPTWLDLDGMGKLSLCGLFNDSEGNKTKVTCIKNNGDNSFSKMAPITLGDYGWSAGRAFTMQNGKGAYCRVVDIIWNRLACALSDGSGYFNREVKTKIIDGGYNENRTWQRVFSGGSTAYCRIIGNIASGFKIRCDTVIGIKTVVSIADQGWHLTRMWLDLIGEGEGHQSFCRLVGLAGNIKLRCRVRLDDRKWGDEVTSNALDGGYDGLRYPIRMNGPAQEYCSVGGSRYEFMTCTKLVNKNALTSYKVPLPRNLNPITSKAASFADVDGDGLDDMCILDRSSKQMYCYLNKGGKFNKDFVVLTLSRTPLGDMQSGITKILPPDYTEEGPLTSLCYNVGFGTIRCDKYLVY